jgi:hypothetical protein
MSALPPSGVAGRDSIGDVFAPELGNAGYDVQHYRLTLAVNPDTAQITGTVVISAISMFDQLGRIRLVHLDRGNYSGGCASWHA